MVINSKRPNLQLDDKTWYIIICFLSLDYSHSMQYLAFESCANKMSEL